MIRKLGVLFGDLGVLVAAFAAMSLTACDQAPTKTEAPKALTPEEARKIREDKWTSASDERDKVKVELAATQDKLEHIIEGTAEGDVEKLAARLKELQDRMNQLTDQMSLLAKPRERREEGEPTPAPHAPVAPVLQKPSDSLPAQK